MWPFAMAMKLWGMSLRFDESPEDVRNYTKCDEPVVMVLWHNRLFLSAEIVRRYRRVSTVEPPDRTMPGHVGWPLQPFRLTSASFPCPVSD